MTLRIFSKKHNLYTNSVSWPSNQRTWSEWSITPNGQVLELILFEDGGSSFAHYKSGFEIEPWTGYFDSTGKKIYRGDILEMFSMFHFVSEVTWKDGAFWTKALDKEGGDSQFSPYLASHWTIKGNIHGVEYSE